MIFINVAAEAITAMTIRFLLSSDKFCFISMFEQTAFVVLKLGFVPDLFAVAFLDIGGTDIDNFVVVVVVVIAIGSVLGVCVVAANVVIGSWTKKQCSMFIMFCISLYILNLKSFLHAEKRKIGLYYCIC